MAAKELAKELTTHEMLMEIIARQAEMGAMLEDQGALLGEIKEKVEEIDEKVDEIGMADWEPEQES